MAGMTAPTLNDHPAIRQLEALRTSTGPRKTLGLTDDLVVQFYESDATLRRAIDESAEAFSALVEDYAEDCDSQRPS